MWFSKSERERVYQAEIQRLRDENQQLTKRNAALLVEVFQKDGDIEHLVSAVFELQEMFRKLADKAAERERADTVRFTSQLSVLGTNRRTH